MVSLRQLSIYLRRYTSVQLLIVSSVLLFVLTLALGPLFSVTVVVTYLITNALWNFQLQPLFSKLLGASFSASVGETQDFTETTQQVGVIKDLIAKSFILSWTSQLELDKKIEDRLTEGAHLFVDELLTLLSTKQINIYYVVTDLIKGAHIHIDKYNVAMVEPVQRKSVKMPESKCTVEARYLELSLSEWSRAHKEKQPDYFRSVTRWLLCKLLPINTPAPIALEALSCIISENVLAELLAYLSKKENLLRLVITILANDFEALVKSAEISSTSEIHVNRDKSEADVVEAHHGEVLSVEISRENAQAKDCINAEASNILSDATVHSDQTRLVASADSDRIIGDQETSVEGNSTVTGMEYVSENLMKYFRVAPSSPTKISANKTHHGSNESAVSLKATPSTGEISLPSPADLAVETPKVIPMMCLAPALAVPSSAHQTGSSAFATDSKPKTVPMSALTAAISNGDQSNTHDLNRSSEPKTVPSARSVNFDQSVNEFTPDQSGHHGNSQSFDSGLADVKVKTDLFGSSPDSVNSNQTYAGVKYLSVHIPTTSTRTERLGSSKYTLYVISYQAVYPSNENEEPEIKDCQVYRRFREFMNLRARLEKSSSYSKALRSVKGPSLWQQLSLGTRKPHEVERRRAQLERFLQQLIVQPLIRESKDVEEFLAYNGSAEIEFVQEKVEFIPPVARLDKVMIRMFDNLTDKLTSQSQSPSEGSKYSETGGRRKSKKDLAVSDTLHSTMFNISTTIHSDLLTIREEKELTVDKPTEFFTTKHSPNHIVTDDEYHSQSDALADSLFQLILLLLQRHSDTSKNSRTVSTVSSLLVPYLSKWLKNKVHVYSTPSELARLLGLFRQTIWPEEEEVEKQYDIKKLERVARQCVLDELPAPVTLFMRSHVDSLIDDVLNIVEVREVNEQLVYILLDQLLQNSLSVLIN